MDAYPHEAQLAIISFLTAVGIAGPLALLGPPKFLAASRWVVAFIVRRKLATLAVGGLVGGGSALGVGALGQLASTGLGFPAIPTP
ncbi:hypothetical protein [Maricaulis sp.]|uniref:hypothetical protein n=1 Tax=Maricaulis sp. TaxID=1486257 RepID=UPI002B277EDA|nr:hypothetical protein [Maricaulis sp.]